MPGLSLFDDVLPPLDSEPGTEAEGQAQVPAVVTEPDDILGIVNSEPDPAELEEAVARIAALEQLSDAALADAPSLESGPGLLGFDFDLWYPKPESLPAVVPAGEADPGTEVAVAPAPGNQIISATGKNTYGYQAALRVAETNRRTLTHEPTAFTLMKADEIEAMSEATKASKNQLGSD
jgi:hypothetical protein